MCKENLYAKVEKVEARILQRCTRQGLKVIPWLLLCFMLSPTFSVTFSFYIFYVVLNACYLFASPEKRR